MKFTPQGLAAAGLNLAAPFSVEVLLAPTLGEPTLLTQTRCNLTFVRLRRILPGRRVSGIAQVDDGETLFAKLFYGAGARRYWQRELRGAARLQRAGVKSAGVKSTGVKSAGVVGQGTTMGGATKDGLGFVVLYQLLADAENLSEEDQPSLLAAVDILAGLHDANCVQADVHFNNFVRSNGVVYAVDADGVRRARLLRAHFANLAMFLAQRAPWYDHEIPVFWNHYAQQRGDYAARNGSARQLAQQTRRQRRHRVRRYLAKTQRECTEFVHKPGWRRNWLCDRAHWPMLQQFMLFPEVFLGEGTPLKLGNSSTVVRVNIDGGQFIVKRYNLKNFPHRVRRWFKRRARNAWRNGHLLAFMGIATARPVALLEQRWGWFVGVCYLVMPDLGEQNLGQLMAAGDMSNSAAFAELAPQAIAIMQQLRAAQLQHGDLKATNFVVDHGHLSLIDYDALCAGDGAADIDRFLRNWDAEPQLSAAWRSRLCSAGLLPEAS